MEFDEIFGVLYILATFDSPRLRYTLDLVFNRILGIAYQLVHNQDYDPAVHFPLINYSQLMVDSAINLPNHGLLAKQKIEPIEFKIGGDQWPYLFYYALSGNSYQLPYDLFSAVFYLVSQYDKYLTDHRDQHQRYQHASYPSGQYGLEKWPLVHIYCLQLWHVIQHQIPSKHLPPRDEKAFEFELSFDIDFPWKYRHKGFIVRWGGLFKDLFKGAWYRVRERLQTIISGTDPNDTFDQIFEACPPEHTRFFFLIDGDHPNDSRFKSNNPSYQVLIRDIAARSYPIGIHPSYTSYLDADKIEKEKKALEAILGIDITSSRQHFLRYTMPETFRFLLQCGIREEFSLTLFETGGFPGGMARPFPWFDLEANTATDLILHPAQIMDRSLQQYMGLQIPEAIAHCRELIEQTRAVQGQFRIILHNDLLSNSEEWEGWSAFLKALMDELVAK